MAVELIEQPDVWSLRLSGVVGIAEARELAAAARAAMTAGGKDVVVDLHAARVLDTSAAQVLLALKRALTSQGRTLRLDSVPPAIQQRWQRAGLERELY
jgi:anti-anti-sigma regulatory factor